MGLYEAVKDVAKLAQQADNIDLYRRLLDLSAQALDMQDEISKLKNENAELKKRRDVSNEIVRHKEPCITLKNDADKLYYCSHCWDSQQLLIQLNCHHNGTFECPHCKAKGNYDDEIKKQVDIARANAIRKMNRSRCVYIS
jgi:hypothetical protein